MDNQNARAVVPVLFKCNQKTLDELCQQGSERPLSLDSLKFETSEFIPDGLYVIEMSDGSLKVCGKNGSHEVPPPRFDSCDIPKVYEQPNQIFRWKVLSR